MPITVAQVLLLFKPRPLVSNGHFLKKIFCMRRVLKMMMLSHSRCKIISAQITLRNKSTSQVFISDNIMIIERFSNLWNEIRDKSVYRTCCSKRILQRLSLIKFTVIESPSSILIKIYSCSEVCFEIKHNVQ